MAKKAQTPMPPRRVQAPKVRTADRHGPGDDERRRRLFLYGLGASGFVGLLAVLLVVLLTGGNGSGSSTGGSNSAIAKTMAAAGYSYKQFAIPVPPKRQTHVASLDAKVTWQTDPPAGGQHYQTPAPFNFYDEAVNPLLVVHNEEHGAMVIWYGPKISAQTKQKLRAFYDASPNGIVATPYAPLGNGIVLTAWTGDPNSYQRGKDFGEGHYAKGVGFNEKAFKAFRDAFRGKGPEGFKLAALTPGN